MRWCRRPGGVRTASAWPTLRTVPVQMRYATQQLGYPGLGHVAVQHRRRHRRLRRLRCRGAGVPGAAMASCRSARPVRAETTVTPHASFLALATTPQAAFANIQELRTLYPDLYTTTAASTTPWTHDGIGRPPLPGPGPVHDHGLARQRSEPARDPAVLRRRSGLVGRPYVSVGREDVAQLTWPEHLQKPEGHPAVETRPPVPPFDRDDAIEKVRAAEDGWNTRDPERVALAYTPDSRWRNRSEFFAGRAAIVDFLTRKWVQGARLPADQGAVDLRRRPHRCPVRL